MKEPEITKEVVEQHGLTPAEFEMIKEILGRPPNFTELGIFSVMWSEHCSYKCSKNLLRTFPTEGKRVLVGPGENAGVVDVGGGYAVAFKIESHNHPSAIEPYQGAATGIGGILRDIFTMGARPIALLDPLRFGQPELPRNQHIIGGVISGIADYGNCVGVPTVAGDIYFSPAYTGNPLINVMCVGLMPKDKLTLARAHTPGSYAVYYGNSTGRDGIHGVTFASEELSDESEAMRSAVQVGDPFMGKKILEATLELIEAGAVEAIQDMGGAGLTCSTCEMAGRGGTGIEIDLNKVPKRATGLIPYEIMLSESQERMLAIVPVEKIDLARRILNKWEVGCHIIGQVTGDGLLRVKQNGKVVAEMPAAKISSQSPVYQPESRRSSYLDYIEQFTPERFPEPDNYEQAILKLLSSPTIASKRWVYEQYDHMVQTNTVVGPGESAGVLRIKGTSNFLALTADCNSLFCYLDPYEGGKIAVAEAARNLTCAGAEPIGITNCLNFGNPQKPEIYYQFEMAVKGMGDVCRKLDIPITGGNVSFYNETEGTAVYPTPVIGMLGLIEDQRWITTTGFKDEGDVVVVLGPRASHLGGSHYFYYVKEQLMGPAPVLDIDYEQRLQELCRRAIRAGLIKSAQDIAEGGLAVALAECCINSPKGLGATIQLKPRIRMDVELFSEEQSRIVVTAAKEKLRELSGQADSFGIHFYVIGRAAGQILHINNISIPVDKLKQAYQTDPLK